YWKADGGDGRIISVRAGYLYVLSAATGKPVESFGNGGRVPLARAAGGRATGGGGPTVVRDVIVVGGAGGGPRGGDSGDQMESIPESVLAFDARNGAKLWEFSPMPVPDDPMRETWSADSARVGGAMGSYGLIGGDEDLGYVYVPFSAPNPP